MEELELLRAENWMAKMHGEGNIRIFANFESAKVFLIYN